MVALCKGLIYSCLVLKRGETVKSQFTLLFILFSGCLFVSSTVWSIDAIEFDIDEHHERFQALTFELRCPLCQNQNLTDSNSKISVDLRREVARLIQEGKTDDEIKQHMVSLYGDFILYKPPVQNNTLILWLGPVAMGGIGLIIFAVIVFNRSRIAGNIENEFDEDDVDNFREAEEPVNEVENGEVLSETSEQSDVPTEDHNNKS